MPVRRCPEVSDSIRVPRQSGTRRVPSRRTVVREKERSARTWRVIGFGSGGTARGMVICRHGALSGIPPPHRPIPAISRGTGRYPRERAPEFPESNRMTIFRGLGERRFGRRAGPHGRRASRVQPDTVDRPRSAAAGRAGPRQPTPRPARRPIRPAHRARPVRCDRRNRHDPRGRHRGQRRELRPRRDHHAHRSLPPSGRAPADRTAAPPVPTRRAPARTRTPARTPPDPSRPSRPSRSAKPFPGAAPVRSDERPHPPRRRGRRLDRR